MLERLTAAYSAFITRRDARAGTVFTPAIRNVRPPVGVFPQAAPDPIRQGDFLDFGHPRAHVPIWTSGDEWIPWEQEDFIQSIFGPTPHARPPSGAMEAFGTRANLARPAFIAYGSLFQTDTEPYGLA